MKKQESEVCRSTQKTCGSIETIAGKPVAFRENARTVLNLKNEKFAEKFLCDGITLNPGDACVYSCEYCYVEPQAIKFAKGTIDELNFKIQARGEASRTFDQVVVRRKDPLKLLRKQLFHRNGESIFSDPKDNRVVYGSTLVDVAPTMEILRETAGLCNEILEHTAWQIRLLSKGSLLHRLFKDDLIAERHRHRLILGFSTGTLDDKLARTIERGTGLVSKRLESLHWLQDEGYRTFGMICPNLPQPDDDYDRFSQEISEAIRVNRCEHVWAEVINLRGKSFARTLAALVDGGFDDHAMALSKVMSPGCKAEWEDYARQTFLAHTRNIPKSKLRFLQYVDAKTIDWWSKQRPKGAVLLGKLSTQTEAAIKTAAQKKNKKTQ
jgi:DNA repair photolyase